MTKVSLSDLDKAFGYKDPQDTKAGLFGVLTELQGITLSIVSGIVAAKTGMTISGINTEDTIISAVEVLNDNSQPITRTLSIVISGANTIYCNDTLSALSKLHVLWFNKA